MKHATETAFIKSWDWGCSEAFRGLTVYGFGKEKAFFLKWENSDVDKNIKSVVIADVSRLLATVWNVYEFIANVSGSCLNSSFILRDVLLIYITQNLLY